MIIRLSVLLIFMVMCFGCVGKPGSGTSTGIRETTAGMESGAESKIRRIAVPAERGWDMRLVWLGGLLMLALVAAGCSGKFWGGTATGVLGTGAGYEYKADREMRRITEALEQGEITQEEYEIRKDQIERMSVVQ